MGGALGQQAPSPLSRVVDGVPPECRGQWAPHEPHGCGELEALAHAVSFSPLGSEVVTDGPLKYRHWIPRRLWPEALAHALFSLSPQWKVLADAMLEGFQGPGLAKAHKQPGCLGLRTSAHTPPS